MSIGNELKQAMRKMSKASCSSCDTDIESKPAEKVLF